MIVNLTSRKFVVIIASIVLTSCITRNYNYSTVVNANYESAYRDARNSGDMNLTLSALNLLIHHSKDSLKYCDTMAYLYFNLHAYDPCIYWAGRSLSHNDSNTFALMLISRSHQKNSEFVEAIRYLEQLIRIDPKPEYSLYLLESQYGLKRLLECIKTSEIARSIPANYPYSYSYLDSTGHKRSTNLSSAILNYRGMAYYELGDYGQAENSFVTALNQDPEFKLAEFNLRTTRQKIKNP